MTIYLYSGTPGSGKSLHATMRIKDSLDFKKPVIANYPLNDNVKGYECFTYKNNEELTPEYLTDYAREYWEGKRFKEDRILLVLDECQLLFNSREWNNKDRMAWLEFFSQHRKMGYEVLFVAQFDRMVDRQIRSLIEYEYVHRKLGNFGIRGKMVSAFLGGNTIVCVKRFYPLKEKVGTALLHPRKRIFKMYDSYAQFKRTDGQRASGDSGDPCALPARPQ